MYQQTYTYFIFVYFTPLVLVGSFFLLNLTLAVINSKFTEAHNDQQKADQEALRDATNLHNNLSDGIDDAIKARDEMSIA